MDDLQFIPFEYLEERRRDQTHHPKMNELLSLTNSFQAVLAQGFRLIREAPRMVAQKKETVDWIKNRVQFNHLREHARERNAISKLRRFVIQLKASIDADTESAGIWRRHHVVTYLSDESVWQRWHEKIAKGHQPRLLQLQKRFFSMALVWNFPPAAIIYVYDHVCPELISLLELALSELNDEKKHLPLDFFHAYQNYLQMQLQRIKTVQNHLQKYAGMTLQTEDWHGHADPLIQLLSDIRALGLPVQSNGLADPEWEWRNDETLRLLHMVDSSTGTDTSKKLTELGWWICENHPGLIPLEKRHDIEHLWLVPRELQAEIPLADSWPGWFFFGTRFRRRFFKPFLRDLVQLNAWARELSENNADKVELGCDRWQTLHDNAQRLRAYEDILVRLQAAVRAVHLPWYYRWFSPKTAQMLQHWQARLQQCQTVLQDYQTHWLQLLNKTLTDAEHMGPLAQEKRLANHPKIWDYLQDRMLMLDVGKKPELENITIETYQSYTLNAHPVGRCLKQLFHWLQKQSRNQESEFLSVFIQRQEQQLALYGNDQDCKRLRTLFDLLQGRNTAEQSPSAFADYLLELCACFASTLSSSDLLRLLLQEVVLPRVREPSQPDFKFVAELSPLDAELWLVNERKSISHFLTIMAQLLSKLQEGSQLDLSQPIFLICAGKPLHLSPQQLHCRFQHFKRLSPFMPVYKQQFSKLLTEYIEKYSGQDVQLLSLLTEWGDEEIQRTYYSKRLQYLLVQANWELTAIARECQYRSVPEAIRPSLEETWRIWMTTQTEFIPAAHQAMQTLEYNAIAEDYFLMGLKQIAALEPQANSSGLQNYLMHFPISEKFMTRHHDTLAQLIATQLERPALNESQIFWLEKLLSEPMVSTYQWQSWLSLLQTHKLRLQLAKSLQIALDQAQRALKEQNIEVLNDILSRYYSELASIHSDQIKMVQAFLSQLGQNLRKVIIANIQRMNFYQNNHWQQRCIALRLQETDPVIDWQFLMQLCTHPEQVYLAWFDAVDRGKFHQAMWLRWQQWQAQGWLNVSELSEWASYVRLWEFERRDYQEGCGHTYQTNHLRLLAQCKDNENRLWAVPPVLSLTGSELYYLHAYQPQDSKTRMLIKRYAAVTLIHTFFQKQQHRLAQPEDIEQQQFYHAVFSLPKPMHLINSPSLRTVIMWLWQDWVHTQMQLEPGDFARVEPLRQVKLQLQWLDGDPNSKRMEEKKCDHSLFEKITPPAILQQTWQWLHGGEAACVVENTPTAGK